jgi:hypothetical protein
MKIEALKPTVCGVQCVRLNWNHFAHQALQLQSNIPPDLSVQKNEFACCRAALKPLKAKLIGCTKKLKALRDRHSLECAL